MEVVIFVDECYRERYPIEKRRAISQFIDEAVFELQRVPLKGESIQIIIGGNGFFGKVTDDPYVRISFTNGYMKEDYCVSIDLDTVDLGGYKK